MIYVFTGITNFEELAKIFTRYKIILFRAQSSGIFMGILFIDVGILFKINVMRALKKKFNLQIFLCSIAQPCYAYIGQSQKKQLTCL
jgi:hypothetical protein